ncbi:MAG: NAD-binding protein [Gammaproteobacteria bacterium]|nr:NAD-binding protein [Gammaproteobacteria bacterium]
MHPVVALVLRRMRVPLVLLVLVYAISILGMVLIPGVDDNGQPWNMTFFHAFYFVSFMATTIGFGEIPFSFTEGQRIWVSFIIYLAVISWLYAIGKILTLVQSRKFQEFAQERSFERTIRAINEPFYIICGYGDTGSMLTRALISRGIRVVVIDIEESAINTLSMTHHIIYVPGLCADVRRVETLKEAGLLHNYCLGVVALTNDDLSNLKVAITAKLLNPSMKVICRAENHDTEANMASFGTDRVINPFDIFATRLVQAFHSPGLHILFEWLYGVPNDLLGEHIEVPLGRWILCGYGRFGKAVYSNLIRDGVEVTIIEAEPEKADCIGLCVVGRGTEAATLKLAGVEDAVGIVAGTDDDANNLSIIITANQLNPALFRVARQNRTDNGDLFNAANLDLSMRRSHVIAHDIFAKLTNPMLTIFLEMVLHQSKSWVNILVSRIVAMVDQVVPELWTVMIDRRGSPAVVVALEEGEKVRLAEIFYNVRDYRQRHPAITLMVRNYHGHYTLTPGDDYLLQQGDELLICSQPGGERLIDPVLKNHNALHYVRTGIDRPSGIVWEWLSRWKREESQSKAE